MQLKDYIRIGRHWGPIALVLAVLCAIGAYAFTRYRVAPVYETSVVMQVQSGSTTSGSVLDPNLANGYANTEAAVASQPIYTGAAIAIVHKALPANVTKDGIKSISCLVQGATSLFSCTVSARNPFYASEVANTLARVFISGERNWQQGAYEQALKNIHQEEKQARLNHDGTTLQSLLTLEGNVVTNETSQASIARVVTPAGVPSVPTSPHPTLNALLAFAAIFGLVLGAGALSDRLDDSVRGEDELKELTGLPVLGLVPSIANLKDKRPALDSLVMVSNQRSAAAEAYRVVRAGISLATIDRPPRSLLVASPIPGEGKSTVAANVAAAFAEAGKSVILVDLDLWHRSISRIFNAPNYGLTNALLLDHSESLSGYLLPTIVPNLRVLPSGPVPPNPAELIGSNRMRNLMAQLEANADMIVVDSPALLAVADAAVAATFCDVSILVVRPDRTKRRSLQRAIDTLNSAGTTVAGLVVNSFGRNDSGYYYDYHPYEGYHPTEEVGTKETARV